MQQNGKRMWIDGHVHINLFNQDGSPVSFSAADVVKVLDESGEDLRLIVSLGGADVGRVGADPDLIHAANEALYQFIQPAEGRLLGSVFVRPDALAQAHADLDEYVGKKGFVQVAEVLGQLEGGRRHGFYGFMDGPKMIEIARHCAELGVPMQFHCSTNNQPDGQDARETLHVAREVPDAKIIIAHAIGGRNSYMHILAAETYLAQGGDNVYLEIIDFHVRDFVRAAVQRLGADRLLVGMDWMNRGGPPFPRYGGMLGMLYPERVDWSHLQGGYSRWDDKIWLNKYFIIALNEHPYPCDATTMFSFMREAGVSDEDADKIASGNAIRLFHLEGRL